MEAIQEVARRHRNAPFALDPVLVELVQTILRIQFGDHPEWAAAWQGASGPVAQTLYEDPVSRERLELLWNRLSKGER